MKNHNLQRLSVTVCLLALTSLISLKARADDAVTIAPSILYFNYAEYDDSGHRLDEEYGALPGLSIDLQIKSQTREGSRAYLQAGASFYVASIKYNGMTQSGIPHTTNTMEGLKDLHFALGSSTGPVIQPLDIFLQFATATWDRDIRSNNGVNGLYELYQWNEVGLGMRKTFIANNDSRFLCTLNVFRVVSPNITVDLNSFGYGTPKMDLKPKPGFKVSFAWDTRIQNKLFYGVKLFYKRYGFGASDVSTINGPSGLLAIQEPRSETQQKGIQFYIYTAL